MYQQFCLDWIYKPFVCLERKFFICEFAIWIASKRSELHNVSNCICWVKLKKKKMSSEIFTEHAG